MFFETSHGVGSAKCNCKHERLWVRFPLQKNKYLIFSFHGSGVEAKRGVEFRYSTRNLQNFTENEVINNSHPLSTCCVRDTAWRGIWECFFISVVDKEIFQYMNVLLNVVISFKEICNEWITFYIVIDFLRNFYTFSTCSCCDTHMHFCFIIISKMNYSLTII